MVEQNDIEAAQLAELRSLYACTCTCFTLPIILYLISLRKNAVNSRVVLCCVVFVMYICMYGEP